jgi:hypothetical protein
MHAEIKAAIAASKGAIELAKAGDIDQEAMQEALEEVRTKLYDAQTAALEALEANSAQADRVRALEAEAAARDDWTTEAEGYELREVSNNVHAWVRKEATGYYGAVVKLCPICFERRKKMILQASQVPSNTGGPTRESLDCGGCGTKIGFNGGFHTANA